MKKGKGSLGALDRREREQKNKRKKKQIAKKGHFLKEKHQEP